ncbi:unnamed protein product [Caenorhabditis angaria]|uniref:Uncharacterized protein n=1 Tax=Caenorhabditis angaria TaxID=860376 RepID=A0A9P1N3X1_9PELO|nr:unnamed protein product [Caenorhabditis angaria]
MEDTNCQNLRNATVMTTSSVNDFTRLLNGDLLNLSTKLKCRPAEKKKESVEKKLETYRTHFRTSQINVPPTNVTDLGNLLQRVTFKCPSKYIDYKIPEINEKTVEYDIDEEDQEWIEASNQKRAAESVKEISVEKFELAIDRMEKCCKFENHPSGSGSHHTDNNEIDDVCCICADGEVTNANQIIYCDMCNIAVHQDCYGVPYIPEGSWLCRKCKLSPSLPVSCCLCPNEYGAFKPTSDGRWAHVVCAIWLNEVHFGNAVFLEPIEGVNETLRVRKTLRCLYCRLKKGACIQCSSRMCIKAFHVTCAQKLGLVMKIETAQEDDGDGEDFDVKRFVYCQRHSENLSAKEFQKTLKNARKNLVASGGHRPMINTPSISRENVDKIAKETNIVDFEDVVVYWYQKRRSRAGVPLIKRLNVEIKQRIRKAAHEMSDEETKVYEDKQTIRKDLELARLMTGQILKRETDKRKKVLDESRFLLGLAVPVSVLLDEIWNRLKKADSKDVFANPVDVEGYSTIIKNPMDLSKIRKSIDKQKYDSIAEMRKDVQLMIENCMKFNRENPYYYDYGKRFKRSTVDIFENYDGKDEKAKAIEDPDNFEIFMKRFKLEVGEESEMEEDAETKPETKSETKQIQQKKEEKLTPNSGLFPIFSGGSIKRKNNNAAPTTTPKRVKKNDTPITGNSSILPFLNNSSKQMTFDSVKKSATTPIVSVPRSSRFSARSNGGFRDSSAVRSPLPADTASSTEESMDEEIVTNDEQKNSKYSSKKKQSTSPKKMPKFMTPKEAPPIEKAKNEIKSIFAHNAIVNVDGKAAKVIDIQYAFLDISREQRHKMISSRPLRTSQTNANVISNNKNHRINEEDDHHVVYVEFFHKTNSSDQFKWVSSENVSLIDLSTSNKSKIVGLKAAKEWQQSMMSK